MQFLYSTCCRYSSECVYPQFFTLCAGPVEIAKRLIVLYLPEIFFRLFFVSFIQCTISDAAWEEVVMHIVGYDDYLQTEFVDMLISMKHFSAAVEWTNKFNIQDLFPILKNPPQDRFVTGQLQSFQFLVSVPLFY